MKAICIGDRQWPWSTTWVGGVPHNKLTQKNTAISECMNCLSTQNWMENNHTVRFDYNSYSLFNNEELLMPRYKNIIKNRFQPQAIFLNWFTQRKVASHSLSISWKIQANSEVDIPHSSSWWLQLEFFQGVSKPNGKAVALGIPAESHQPALGEHTAWRRPPTTIIGCISPCVAEKNEKLPFLDMCSCAQ